MTIEEYFGDWLKVIDKDKLGEVLQALSKLDPETVCPSPRDTFRAFRLCPFDDCRVVFLGQDPYPQKGVATGILFGNRGLTPESKLSPSLQVIKESCIDYSIPHGVIDFDNTLESWAKQGILMLNSALTCEVNKPNSHTMLWRRFMSSFLNNLSIRESGIIYVLFGAQARTFAPYICEKYNHIIKVGHPAQYARINRPMPNKVFTSVNELLYSDYGDTITWFTEY
jgi:uracil-DNA glycosylase